MRAAGAGISIDDWLHPNDHDRGNGMVGRHSFVSALPGVRCECNGAALSARFVIPER